MIFNSSNCKHCFDITDCEHCTHTTFTPKGLWCRDATYSAPDGVEYCYETCSTVGTSQSMATFLSWYNDSAYYSMECHSCRDIFGCVGLRNKQFCIFNKQYEKEERHQKVDEILSQMEKE